MTKAERHKNRKMSTLGTLGNELTNFGDLRALEPGASVTSSLNRKRKSTKGKGGKKKSKSGTRPLFGSFMEFRQSQIFFDIF
mgnify:CR=1 FL=1